MKHLSKYALALFLLAPFSVKADFDAGRQAANSGDFARALAIWEPLATNGDAQAQHALARMYARGDGVPKDLFKARELVTQAAGSGFVKAEVMLAKMLYRADGGNADPTGAISWFRRAAAKGDEESRQFLERLNIPLVQESSLKPSNTQIRQPLQERDSGTSFDIAQAPAPDFDGGRKAIDEKAQQARTDAEFDDGRRALLNGDYQKAKDIFESLANQDYPGARDALNRVTQQLKAIDEKAQQARTDAEFDDGRRALLNGDYQKAKDIFESLCQFPPFLDRCNS